MRRAATFSSTTHLTISNHPDRSHRARPAKKSQSCVEDAGLSRWLLALANSDVPPRANVPQLRDHERAPRNQRPAQFQRPRTAPFGRRPAGCVPAPQRQVSGVLMEAGLSRALLFVRRPATSLRKRPSQLMDSFGLPGVLASPTRPALPASQPLCRCSLKKRCERASTEWLGR